MKDTDTKEKQVDSLHFRTETNDLTKRKRKNGHGNYIELWKGQQQDTAKVSRSGEIHRGKSAVTND